MCAGGWSVGYWGFGGCDGLTEAAGDGGCCDATACCLRGTEELKRHCWSGFSFLSLSAIRVDLMSIGRLDVD